MRQNVRRELESAFGADRSKAAEGRHELEAVLLEEELLEVGADLGQVRKIFGAFDVEHRVEEIRPQLRVPPSKKNSIKSED